MLEPEIDQPHGNHQVNEQGVPAYKERVGSLELVRNALANLAEGVLGADLYLVGAKVDVCEQVFLLGAPGRPGVVVMQAVAVQGLSEGVQFVIGKTEGESSVVEIETADVQLGRKQLGRSALVQVEPDQLLIVSYPGQSAVDQHGIDFGLGKGLHPLFQFFRHIVVEEAGAVTVAVPHVALVVYVLKEFGDGAFVLLLEPVGAGFHKIIVTGQGQGPHALSIFLETGDIGNIAHGLDLLSGAEAADALQFSYQVGTVSQGGYGKGELGG